VALPALGLHAPGKRRSNGKHCRDSIDFTHFSIQQRSIMMHITVNRSAVPSFVVLLLCAGAAQAAPCQNNLPASNPDSVYTNHGDGTVTDTRTGLMWKQCAEGLSGADCQTGTMESFNWADALAHAEVSTFADHTNWRLPNVNELFSLVEDCQGYPAINTTLFPNTPVYSSNFWSGSPYARNLDRAWNVFFSNGVVDHGTRNSSFRVRLVRDAQ